MKQFCFNCIEVNCYLIWDDATREAAVIDSAMMYDSERKVFQKFVEDNDLRLVMALQTHMHFDHIFGLPFVHKHYGLQPRCHADDQQLYAELPQWLARMGMTPEEGYPEIGEVLKDNEVIELGSIRIQVLHTPGHTPGGVSFYVPSESLVFTGDTLFAGSLGRTDFPGGNFEQEILSIRNRLFQLPESTKVLPGHGPSSTIGREIQTNPYF